MSLASWHDKIAENIMVASLTKIFHELMDDMDGINLVHYYKAATNVHRAIHYASSSEECSVCIGKPAEKHLMAYVWSFGLHTHLGSDDGGSAVVIAYTKTQAIRLLKDLEDDQAEMNDGDPGRCIWADECTRISPFAAFRADEEEYPRVVSRES